MANRVLIVFMVLDFLFACTGGLILAFSVIFNPATSSTGLASGMDGATGLLLGLTPLGGGIANAIIIFLTFLISIPGILRSNSRAWIRVQSWLVLLCGLISLILGLTIWFSTLRTRANLASAWSTQDPQETSKLQDQFQCCGYLDFTSPPYIIDDTCTDDATAERLGGCAGPFSSFANSLLDVVFTTMFGAVALDGLLFLSALVVLKDRAEKVRYRLIDQKYGKAGI